MYIQLTLARVRQHHIQYTHYENWVDILKHRGALRAHKLKAYAFSSWFFHLALCSCFSLWTHNTHRTTACMYPREREHSHSCHKVVIVFVSVSLFWGYLVYCAWCCFPFLLILSSISLRRLTLCNWKVARWWFSTFITYKL